MNKSLETLSDKQLTDVLNATLLSYKVYLEENYSTTDRILIKDFLSPNKIKEFWIKSDIHSTIIDEKDPKEMADVMHRFVKLYALENASTYNSFIRNKEQLYKILSNSSEYKSEFEKLGTDKEQVASLLAKKDVFLDLVQHASKAIYKELKSNVIYSPGPIPLTRNKKFLDAISERLEFDINNIKITDIYGEQFPLNVYRTILATTELSENFESIDKSYLFNEFNGNFLSKKGKQLEYSFNDGFILIGEKDKEKDTSILVNYVKNANDEPVLNITFRGTEGKAKDILNYFKYDYMNMERHYDNLEVPVEKIIDSAIKNNKTGKPLKVTLNGHSLGSAMIEKFLDKHENNKDVEYKAIAIASPGGIHRLQKIADFLDKNAKPMLYLLNLNVALINASTQLGANIVKKSIKFINVGANPIINILDKELTAKAQDPRILFIKNSNDPVPMGGSLLYDKPQDSIILDKNYGSGTNMMGNHKMFNYYEQIFDEVKTRPHLKDKLEKLFIIEESIASSPYLKNIEHKGLQSYGMYYVESKIEEALEKSAKSKLQHESNFKVQDTEKVKGNMAALREVLNTKNTKPKVFN
jgi:hypothetical protein